MVIVDSAKTAQCAEMPFGTGHAGVRPRHQSCIKWVCSFVPQFSSCLSSLHDWFCHNGLSLNSSKSESILFGSSQRMRSFPAVTEPTIAGSIIPISDSIKVLGVILDTNLTLKQHTLALCRNIHYHSCALRHIRLVLSIPMASSVAAAIVQSRLDYANSLLYGTSTTNIHKLQCTQNTKLSRIVLSNSPYRHFPADLRLAHLHWLPVDMRIRFKIATLTYNCLLYTSDAADE